MKGITCSVMMLLCYMVGKPAAAAAAAAAAALQQGSLVAINDLITEGPDPSSPKLGHAQGVYLVSTFFPDLPHLHQQFTSVFTAKYNGTISYQGDDGHLLLPQREIAVVGGTGQFRSASGYCFIRTVKQTDAWSYILEFETHLSVPHSY